MVNILILGSCRLNFSNLEKSESFNFIRPKGMHYINNHNEVLNILNFIKYHDDSDIKLSTNSKITDLQTLKNNLYKTINKYEIVFLEITSPYVYYENYTNYKLTCKIYEDFNNFIRFSNSSTYHVKNHNIVNLYF